MKIKLFIMAVLVASALSACSLRFSTNKEENGKIIEKTFDIKDFNSLELGGYAKVYYPVGDTFSVRVSTAEGDMKKIKVENSDSTLLIGNVPDADINSRIWRLNNRTWNERKVYVTAPYLKNISVAGAADIICNDTIVTEDFCVSIAGAGKAHFACVKAHDVDLSIAGAASITADIQDAAWTELGMAGAGTMDIGFHDCVESRAQVAGVGSIKLRGVLGTLQQKVAGVGKINTDKLTLTGKKYSSKDDKE